MRPAAKIEQEKEEKANQEEKEKREAERRNNEAMEIAKQEMEE